MQFRHNRRTRLPPGVVQFLLGIAGIAFITFICFQAHFGLARTAFAYLIPIAALSLLGSFSASVLLSVVAAACLNYFFAPPLFELRIDVPDDIERIAVFLTTSLIVTALTTKVRASEARFRMFVDRATDAFFLLDDRSTVLDVNRQACDSLGYSRGELIGKHRSDFDIGLDDPSVEGLKQRIIAGDTVTFESRHKRKDGTSFPVEVRVSQLEQGSNRFLCLVRNIAERKQRDDNLRASEERFRSVVDHATDGFFLFDEQQALVDVNRQACESLGYSREEIIGMHPSDFDAGLDKASIERIGERVKNGETVTFETLHRRKDGTAFPVEVRARQFQRGAHRVRLSLARDITERKHAEEKLRESEERFRTLMQFSFDVYWETDAQHRFIRQDFSDRVADGPLPGSELGKTRWELPYLEIDEEGWRKHREILDAHLPFRDLEYARPAPNGGKRWMAVSGLPLFEKTGRFIGYRGVGRDITDRKRIEEALRRSEFYLAEAQRLSHTGTIVFSATGPVYWSQESYRIWGLEPLQGLPDLDTVLQRIHPDDRDNASREAFQALDQKTTYAIEFRIVLPDGTVKHLESVGYPLSSVDGEEMIGTHIDVTERKRAQAEHERLRQLESELAHVNRLSIMGELAASLAHEILHPIATARNNARAGARFLELNPPNLAEVREALACIVRDADRAKDIVARMRDHVKKAPPRTDPFDLNEAIHEVLVMAQNAIEKNRVSVRTCLTDRLDLVRGDRVQVQQVLFNLILNSVEAMSSVEEGTRELSISAKRGQASHILVAVQDSGPGIDPEHFERVFAPFYTTKSTGIGMGLSICRSIITAHGGRLWAETNRPRGAVFQFTLPAGKEDL